MVVINAIVFGVELCASAGFTYIPPMLLKSGIPSRYMSLVLGLGPLICVLTVPVIGQLSDNCTSAYGRRRPFIFVLSLVVLASLFLIPFGGEISNYFGGGAANTEVSVILLTVSVVLFDFGTQACLTPCEALLGDMSSADTHSRIFVVYSFMCSVGGVFGYLVSAVDWSRFSIGNFVGGQEKCTFFVLIFCFVASMAATLVGTPEQRHLLISKSKTTNGATKRSNPSYVEREIRPKNENGVVIFEANPPNRLSHIRLHINDTAITRASKTCPCLLRNFSNIPAVVRRLSLANFFSWSAILCFTIFYSDYVGQAIYKGRPTDNVVDNDSSSSGGGGQYDEGVRISSLGLFFHSVVSAAFSAVIELFFRRFGAKGTYLFGMFSFTLSMLVIAVSDDIVVVNILASFTGIAYAVTTTIPCTLITLYHDDKKMFFHDRQHGAEQHGFGEDMATMDSAYFLAQIVLSLFTGYLVHVTQAVLSYILLAAVLGVLSCICIVRIVCTESDVISLLNRNKASRR
ncbi:solute carrier family 45 member 3-like [Tubulanus polymorphus]|uniref:solute carrier family 45 member 3-like n=1 Tax=Tubulanus polymorphus TaxID=672921 RepID=UPI003DA66960